MVKLYGIHSGVAGGWGATQAGQAWAVCCWTRLLANQKYNSYTALLCYYILLQSSNLPTLASRRRYLKLCFLYQVIEGQFDFPGAPVVWRNLPLNLRNNSTFLLLRPVTHSSMLISSPFFPTLLTYGIPSSLKYIVVTLCTLLNVLYCSLIMYNLSIPLYYLGYNYQLAICY